MTNEPNETEALIAELQQAGIKHTPERIVKIARTPDGKIVFLAKPETSMPAWNTKKRRE